MIQSGVVFTKLKYTDLSFFRYFSSVFGIFRYYWNTDSGIGILKYLGIRYCYRLPTQDYPVDAPRNSNSREDIQLQWGDIPSPPMVIRAMDTDRIRIVFNGYGIQRGCGY